MMPSHVPCNCGRRKPNFYGQQDGRVVKAPSLSTKTDYICAGYVEVRVLLTKSLQGRDGAKSRSLVTVAGVSQIIWQRDGRVVKALSLSRRME